MPTKPPQVAEKLVAEKPDLELYQVLLGLARAAQKDYPGAEKILAADGEAEPGFRSGAQKSRTGLPGGRSRRRCKENL